MSEENTPLDKACAEIERQQARINQLRASMLNGASMLEASPTQFTAKFVAKRLREDATIEQESK